jgi:Ca2+:H+ antiporter
VARTLLWALLVLSPVTIALRFSTDVGDVPLFLIAAAALIPLAWLIGEATEHAAEHTGPGMGGFLNASFGNAPELIIALFAVNNGLPDVVRGSITGSIVSNLLLVLGFAIALGGDRPLDRISMMGQLAIVLWAVALFLIPSVPSWGGDPNSHGLAVASIPVAIVLLAMYVVVTVSNLRRHHRLHLATADDTKPRGWSLTTSLVVLGVATAVTALVSEILVHSLGGFADAAGLSEFFVSAVIVAIVGNAAEHGGAVVIARRGKLKLASEIAASSGAQVALLVTPAVALLSWVIKPELSLAFRPIEIATMGGAALFVAAVVWDGRGARREGLLMLAAYAVVVIAYGLAGDI